MKIESGLFLNERTISVSTIITKIIKVDRINRVDVGTRIGCIIRTTDRETFQRWSAVMNPSDEIMMLLQEDDEIEIDYIENTVSDNINKTFDTFERNIILQMRYLK